MIKCYWFRLEVSDNCGIRCNHWPKIHKSKRLAEEILEAMMILLPDFGAENMVPDQSNKRKEMNI